MFMMDSAITRVILISIIILEFSVSGQKNKYARYEEAKKLASEVHDYFFILFDRCVDSTMPNQKFLVDDLNTFVNYPSRTTVGLGAKFTSNRKFFANLISTTAFKEMLAKDENVLRENLLNKLRFCDEAVMDQSLMREMYDREVDLGKI